MKRQPIATGSLIEFEPASIKAKSLGQVFTVVLLVVFFIAVSIWVYKKSAGENAPLKFKDFPYVLGGGEVSASWMQHEMPSYVSDLQQVFDYEYWIWEDKSPRCQALERTYKLSDNKLIAVANAYRKTLKNKVTLKRSMTEKPDDGCGLFKEEYGQLLLSRLNQLGIP